MKKKKRAVIAGITGQDGSYLAELLLKKKYDVIGIASGKHGRENIASIENKLTLVRGDITNRSFVRRIIKKYRPAEFYNLASIATVEKPWERIQDIVESCSLAPLYMLDAILLFSRKTRFFQASSAQMYGALKVANEKSAFEPRNPYGVAKLFAHNLVKRYREDRGLYAVSGILFNHESPRRPKNFVTRKITAGMAAYASGRGRPIHLRNLDAKRDWGFSGDYVRAMQTMLQLPKPQDFIIASGQLHSIRELVEKAAKELGLHIRWKGEGEHEVGVLQGKAIIRLDKKAYRYEPLFPRGDARKAKRVLKWEPTVSFAELVRTMVHADLREPI